MSFECHLWALFFHIYFFWLPHSLLSKVPFALSKDIRLWSSLSRSCVSAIQKKPASLVRCSSCWNFWCVLKNSAASICWLTFFLCHYHVILSAYCDLGNLNEVCLMVVSVSSSQGLKTEVLIQGLIFFFCIPVLCIWWDICWWTKSTRLM